MVSWPSLAVTRLVVGTIRASVVTLFLSVAPYMVVRLATFVLRLSCSQCVSLGTRFIYCTL